jgi:hypothetical protein
MWPAIHDGEKRAITWEEHSQIIVREANPERVDFYELCWHLGESQTDIASLHGEDIDWAHSESVVNRRGWFCRGSREGIGKTKIWGIASRFASRKPRNGAIHVLLRFLPQKREGGESQWFQWILLRSQAQNDINSLPSLATRVFYQEPIENWAACASVSAQLSMAAG